MAIRYIRFSVSDDTTVTPATPQYGGVQGEHNATQVAFYIPPYGPLANPNYQYYIECVDAAGGYDRTDRLERVSDEVRTLVPLAWTQYGGISTVRLVIEEGGTVICSLEGRLQFEDRADAMEKVDSLLRTDMSRCIDTCHEAEDVCRETVAVCEEIRRLDSAVAAAAANEAAAAANAAADNANDAADDAARVREEVAEGGFIESLRELNRGDKFRVWVGSQEEYTALGDTPINTLCILDDDEVADYVTEQGIATVSGVTWRYQKWHSGLCHLWAHLTLIPTSSLAIGSSYYTDPFTIRFPFTVNDRVITGNANGLCSVVNIGSGGSYASTDLRLLKPVDFNDNDKTAGVSVNLTVDGTWK